MGICRETSAHFLLNDVKKPVIYKKITSKVWSIQINFVPLHHNKQIKHLDYEKVLVN